MASIDQPASNQPTAQAQPSEQERIACRAYELYLERGEQCDALQNWLDAEREILGSPAQGSADQARTATAKGEG